MNYPYDLSNPNPYLADPRNKMFVQKVERNSKIVWLGSWLNKVGQPMSDKFSTLKLAKQHAQKIGIPYEVSKQVWI